MNRQFLASFFVLILIFLTSCTGIPAEIPSVAPQFTPLSTYSPEPVSTATAESQPILDQAYYDGIIVITQYYTFLGHGLHEKAYWLLSTSAQRPQSFEEYVENKRRAFKTVEIVSVEPYYVNVYRQGGQIRTPDTENRIRFTVQIRAWGEGAMSGSVMSGDLQLLFLTLVKEDGGWKIDSFSTSP